MTHGIEKEILFNSAICFSKFGDKNAMEKFAEANNLDMNIMTRADEIDKTRQHAKNVVSVVIGVTGWEMYGPNDNGDAFPAQNFGSAVQPHQTLLSRHFTFTKHGKVFRYHESKDPEKSIGIIHFSWWNPSQHRIELIVEFFWVKAATECLKLRRKNSIVVSMGCRLGVPDETGRLIGADYCSYCGQKATKPVEHCDHVKLQLGKIIDGVPVYMINSEEIFFDLSSVCIPGDMNARAVYTAPGVPLDENKGGIA